MSTEKMSNKSQQRSQQDSSTDLHHASITASPETTSAAYQGYGDRQRQDISMFAAYANAEKRYTDYELSQQQNLISSNVTDTKNTEVDRQRREMNIFAAFANPGHDDLDNSIGQTEENRRHREMSIFSSYANADFEIKMSPDQRKTSDMSGSLELQQPSKLLTTIKESTGTFVLGQSADSGLKNCSDTSNKHLSAALASLTSEENSKDMHISSESSGSNSMVRSLQNLRRTPKITEPYIERILAQRPLFFGNGIPQNAIDKLNNERDTGLWKSKSYNFLRNAIEAFGDISMGSETGIWIDKSSYVTLFEPVWGNEARLRREDRIDAAYDSLLLKDTVVDCDNQVLRAVSTMCDSMDTSKVKGDVLHNPSQDHRNITTPISKLDFEISKVDFDIPSSPSDQSESMFLRYARGEINEGTCPSAEGTLIAVPETSVINLDQKGSFEGSELKKYVGINENLSKALESFSEVGSVPLTRVSLTAAEAGEATKGDLRGLATCSNGGRILSNYEISQGKIPLYACDDPALPTLADLGKFETKEDQLLHNRKCDFQEIISNSTIPNIFGSVVCPSAALGPEDSHSWTCRGLMENSNYYFREARAIPNDAPREPSHRQTLSLDSYAALNIKGNGSLPSPLPPAPTKNLAMKHHNAQQSNDGHGSDPTKQSQIGWWNSKINKNRGNKKGKNKRSSCFGSDQSSHTFSSVSKRDDDYSSVIFPQTELLTELNRSLSEMHPASETVKALPLLSDRSPNLRYIQIDTQVVGFPSVGDIEPFFCSLSLWHIQPKLDQELGSVGPDIRKCGRITESLKFDVVNESTVEERFSTSLYYPPSCSKSYSCELGTTRSGIFPVSAAYETSQIHAVLIVHKLLGHESELDVYLGRDKSSKTNERYAHSQKNNERDSYRGGHLITPFAFGVVPLVQIINQHNPTSISSRACQIPLFQYSAGDGSDQIIDHIIALTQPSASSKTADITNGGKAMLIIRDFGYMGPHASLSTKSKLARDRLVDLTREFQVRIRNKNDQETMNVPDDTGRILVMNGWHDEFVIEPACQSNIQSLDYCQELAPIPLVKVSSIGQRHSLGEVEFYTSFHNELVLLPQRFCNCSHKNITIKVEIVQIKKIENGQGYIISLPKTCIHNSRRGPILVDEICTSVAYNKENPSFVEDIKVKLPLEPLVDTFGGQTVVLFTAYDASLNRKNHDINLAGCAEDRTVLFNIGCGFLPLSYDVDSSSLIPNGIYSIDIKYKEINRSVDSGSETIRILQPYNLDITDSEGLASAALDFEGLSDTFSLKEDIQLRGNYEVSAHNSSQMRFENYDILDNFFGDMIDTSVLFKPKKQNISSAMLEVRLVSLSSYHPQNDVLSKFLFETPSVPILLQDIQKSDLSSDSEKDCLQAYHRLLSEPCIENDDRDLPLQHLLMDLSQSNLCPHGELTKHFLRTIQQLWRVLVTGRGHPSLRFANPAMCTSLRLNCFSTILYVISSVSICLSKLDSVDAIGLSKWDVVSLSKIVSMLFDEDKLFFDGNEPKEDCRSIIKNYDSPSLDPLSSTAKEEIPSESLSGIRSDTSGVAVELTPFLETQDDIALISATEKPTSIRTRSFSAPHIKPPKVDTKIEFQMALKASISPPNTMTTLNGVTCGPAASRRKWLGGSISSLATIEENSDDVEAHSDDKLQSHSNESIRDLVDSELVIYGNTHSSQVKQMRVPQTTVDTTDTDFEDSHSLESSQSSIKTVPNMDAIEAVGDTFLQIFGVESPLREKVGEERRVGSSHHRKTKSRCSIDWTLPSTDRLYETQREFDSLDGESHMGFTTNHIPFSLDEAHRQHVDVDRDNCSSKRIEISSTLPSYLDRLRYQKKYQQGRWFPYTYEVITFQWVLLLSEQSRKGPKSMTESTLLAELAKKSFGSTVSCAPILFAVMKKSLGFRIDTLFRQQENIWGMQNCGSKYGAPPLMRFDNAFTSALEKLIIMLTDACIDSRNFDAWSFRNTSFIVNDSIVRFLLDLFAFIDGRTVHRLVMTYFSRYVSRDGKQLQDRDSKIGLRCSWELTKMRLNAVTAFVRSTDFIYLNRPSTSTLGTMTFAQHPCYNRDLFLEALDYFKSLEKSSFAVLESHQSKNLDIPKFKPHWLAELVVDLCLNAISHVEQSIQHRASSLLYELCWSSNLFGALNGSPTVAATLFITFVPKLLTQVKFISNMQPKSQIRKDLLSCAVYILQNGSFAHLKSLFGTLCIAAEGAGSTKQYDLSGFPLGSDSSLAEENIQHLSSEDDSETVSILDFCSLLNLILSTLEYEGSGSQLQNFNQSQKEHLNAEFILHPETDIATDIKSSSQSHLSSNTSRKWFSHDASNVVINTCRTIVREYLSMQQNFQLNETDSKKSSILPDVQSKSNWKVQIIRYSLEDKIVFVRAISSVYLNCLSLRQSDIVISKTLVASIEIVKIFGIDLFLQAIGETLQHWMRVILFHCGARRAKVRVDSLEVLSLILRLQWDSYGTFTRIRVPLLAVQTEVMERIVATSTYKCFCKNRKGNISLKALSTIEVEAALTPFWRTLHRLHHSSASNNAAFKSALQTVASRMKTLYKAYIAAHALVLRKMHTEARNESMSIDENMFLTLRVLMESAEFSKEIIGNNQAALRGESIIVHDEVVEDSLLSAANVFSPSELPFYRIAWLRKLAEFHSLRDKYAEQAACHLEVHKTLRQTLTFYDDLWNSSPFFPWAISIEDPSMMNDDLDQLDFISTGSNQGELSHLFRRIFYRAKDSMRICAGDWNEGGSKTLFNGVAFASDYVPNSCVFPLRELENDMVHEAELAGELFLKAGIIGSSRYCWSLASSYYSEMYNYSRLAFCYKKLANVVASQVPTIDTSSQLDTSSSLGRFYRVYYHGGASGNLMGKEFVYRADASTNLELFCKHLEKTLESILPDRTPIELVLDDGRVHEHGKTKPQQKRQFGAVPREQMIVKVTPLKPIFMQERCARGSSEWFYRQTDSINFSDVKRSGELNRKSFHKHDLSTMCTTTSFHPGGKIFGRHPEMNPEGRSLEHNIGDGAQESLVKRFSFSQPRDRSKCSRDLFKGTDVDVTEKSLRVTELLLSNSMPTCVSRQPVAVENRSVFNQSPLEASIETVCGWCEVLFRTAIATNGASILGDKVEQGIGKAAVKVVAECIHQSRVKETGLVMLDSKVIEKSLGGNSYSMYERLSPEEVKYYQTKLSRSIVIFMELLHVLIGRNRDLLLSDSKTKLSEYYTNRGGLQSGLSYPTGHYSDGQIDGALLYHEQAFDDGSGTYGESTDGTVGTMDRKDKAKALQRELQISFVSMVRALHPVLSSHIHSETPRWMKFGSQDNYFSSGLYRQTRIAIGEELLFFGNTHESSIDVKEYSGIPSSILQSRSLSEHDHESYSEKSIISKSNSRTSLSEYQH